MKGKSSFFEAYNKAQSNSVGIVKEKNIIKVNDDEHVKVSIKGSPNSVTIIERNGIIETERYYDEQGNPYLDIDYTNHGNAGKHEIVPHEHKWTKREDGTYKREKWRNIK